VTVFGSIGLAAARQLEESVGPKSALMSYRAMIGSADVRVRADAVLGALRCAIVLGDEAELAGLCATWEKQLLAPDGSAVRRQAIEQLTRGRTSWALMLAHAEANRRPAARSWYLLARIHELEGIQAYADECYRRAAELVPPQVPIAVAVRARQLELSLQRGAPYGELAPLVESLEGQVLTHTQRLTLGRAQLGSPSKFVRAAGFSTLEEVARAGDPALARIAMRLVALHVERLGNELSWVEAERVITAFSHCSDAMVREQAIVAVKRMRTIAAASDKERAVREAFADSPSAMRYLDVAEALVKGDAIVVADLEEDRSPALALAGAALNAISAMRLGDVRRAERSLEVARIRLARSMPIPAALWTATLQALRHSDPSLRGLGRDLVALLLPRGDPPPRGMLPYARALAAIGAGDLAMTAFRAAAARREAHALEELGEELRARGRQAAVAGHRREAIQLLREAKALLTQE
jgi:tetratricopeptide (TPR) repeat protein